MTYDDDANNNDFNNSDDNDKNISNDDNDTRIITMKNIMNK